MTTTRKRGKPARWPWRSRLDVFFFSFSAVGISGYLFLFLFFWHFSGAFLSCYPSTPAPFPPPQLPPALAPRFPPPANTQHTSTIPPPCPFLALPLPRHSAQQHQLSSSPLLGFFLSRALLQPLRYLEKTHSTRQRPHQRQPRHLAQPVDRLTLASPSSLCMAGPSLYIGISYLDI